MPANFDRVAHLYRAAEYLIHGRLLERVRTHLLPGLSQCRSALVLGDGDGRFLVRLLRNAPRCRALAVDTSPAMLGLLRDRCRREIGPGVELRLRTLCASALEIVPPADADLVVSHFFLDCLTAAELQTLAHRLAAALQPGTLWLLSDFDRPRRKLLRPPAALYVRLLYLVFRVLTGLRVSRLPPVANLLRQAGFLRLERREFAAGLLYTELWQFRPGQPRPPRSYPPHSMPNETSLMSNETSLMPHETSYIPGGAQAASIPAAATDAQPDPEPAVPSLPGPDSGVYHHEPASASVGREPGASGDETSPA